MSSPLNSYCYCLIWVQSSCFAFPFLLVTVRFPRGKNHLNDINFVCFTLHQSFTLWECLTFIFIFLSYWHRHFEAVEARFLRASYSAFVDVLTLATKTIEELGQVMEL